MVKPKIKIKQPIRRESVQRQPPVQNNDFWSVMEEAGASLDAMGRDAQNLV